MKKQNPQKETSKPKKQRKPKSTERPTEGTTHKIEIKNGEKRAKSYNKNTHIRRNRKKRNFPKTEQKKKPNETKTKI